MAISLKVLLRSFCPLRVLDIPGAAVLNVVPQLNKFQIIQPFYRSNQGLFKRSDKKTKDQIIQNSANVEQEKNDFPEPPTTCCMSACANCVWLAYVDQLIKRFDSAEGLAKAEKEINEHVSDPNLRAYLLMEIRLRGK